MFSIHKYFTAFSLYLCTVSGGGVYNSNSKNKATTASILSPFSRQILATHGIHHHYRHDVSPYPRNAVKKEMHVLCVDSLLQINNGVYGFQTQNQVNATFNYKVFTKYPVENDMLHNDYLPKIKDLIAQSLFRNQPMCCDQDLAPMAKVAPTFQTSVIPNLAGVNTTMPLDIIVNRTSCTAVIVLNILLFIADRDEITTGDVNVDTIINDVLGRIELYMNKDYYNCAHPSIESIIYQNFATTIPTTNPTHKPTIMNETVDINETMNATSVPTVTKEIPTTNPTHKPTIMNETVDINETMNATSVPTVTKEIPTTNPTHKPTITNETIDINETMNATTIVPTVTTNTSTTTTQPTTTTNMTANVTKNTPTAAPSANQKGFEFPEQKVQNNIKQQVEEIKDNDMFKCNDCKGDDRALSIAITAAVFIACTGVFAVFVNNKRLSKL